MPSVKKEWYEEGLRFTCTQCGNCCSGPSGFVWFSAAEAETMARHLGLTHAAFLDAYAENLDGRWTLREVKNSAGKYDCVFLREGEDGQRGCSIYPVRPMQCRTWPFWPENLSSRRAWRRAAKICPGMRRGGENGDGDAHGTFFPIEKIRILRDATPHG